MRGIAPALPREGGRDFVLEFAHSTRYAGLGRGADRRGARRQVGVLEGQ